MKRKTFPSRGTARDRRIFRFQNQPHNQPHNNENQRGGPQISREDFNSRRNELNDRIQKVHQRMELLEQNSDNKREWSEYKSQFVRRYEEWNTQYDRIGDGHRKAFQKELDRIISGYEQQITQRDGGEKLSKPDRAAMENRKMQQAMRNPNTWITIENGVSGYQYCYISQEKGQGLYAWNAQYNKLQQLDTSTYTWKGTGWRQGQPLPWEVRQDRKEEVQEEVKEGAKEEVVDYQKNSEISKLNTAKQYLNTWITIENGTPGYQYCYINSAKGQGLYAWNAQTGDLQKMNSNTYTWKGTGWRKGKPLPWDTVQKQETEKSQTEKEISKLNEAKKSPNAWVTVADGVEGASYRYSTMGKDKGLYAWNKNYPMLMKMDTSTYKWENTGWKQGQPLPWEMQEDIESSPDAATMDRVLAALETKFELNTNLKMILVSGYSRGYAINKRGSNRQVCSISLRENNIALRSSVSAYKVNIAFRGRSTTEVVAMLDEKVQKLSDSVLDDDEEEVKEDKNEKVKEDTESGSEAASKDSILAALEGASTLSGGLTLDHFDKALSSYEILKGENVLYDVHVRDGGFLILSAEDPDSGYSIAFRDRTTDEVIAKFDETVQKISDSMTDVEDEVEKKEKVEEKEVEEISELKEAKENPNKWLTIKSGLKGFRYCYSTAGSDSLLALNPDGDILQHNISSNTWDAIAWDSSIPLPEGMKVGDNGKLEKMDPRDALHQKKLDEAMRHPNVWRNLEHGVSGAVYCYVENKGFYAYRTDTGQFFKNVPGSPDFVISEWTRDIPKPPGFRIIKSGPVLQVGGSDIGTPEAEGLTGSEYVSRVKELITTQADYIQYEGLFIDPYQPGRRFDITKSMEREIRIHGKDIMGVSRIEEAILSEYGISIDTEDTNDYASKSDPYPVKNIKNILIDMQKQLGFYPPEFIKTSQLKKVSIARNWKILMKKDGKDVEVPCVGFSESWNGRMATASMGRTFHHELLHQADYADGGLDDENALWVTTAHGPEYLKGFYGKHGTEAILDGTAHGDRPEGFAEMYGKSGGVNEDQATIAEMMMSSPANYKTLAAWANGLPDADGNKGKPELALLAKMKLTKEFYYKTSGGRMDDTFWKDYLSEKTIDTKYWHTREARGEFAS